MLFEISPGVSAMLWWLLPVGAPFAAWVLIRRKSRANPNADISEGINELRRFQKALGKDQDTKGKSE